MTSSALTARGSTTRRHSSPLDRHAARIVAGWPPPTDEQIARVAALLTAGSNGGAS